MHETIDSNELWMLSLYRKSEIGGALFFAKLANALKPSQIQFDMTRHFADESRHAWEWTNCIARLGGEPLDIGWAYQDHYLRAAGVPINIMEILAITFVFERRVFAHYASHLRLPGLRREVVETLRKIMNDEKGHLAWVRKALKEMEQTFGADDVQATMKRFTEADRHVYREVEKEHSDRLQFFRNESDRETQEMFE